jgi:D-glycero-D-manno-heptose 1,7-bisphosphate phosphatase
MATRPAAFLDRDGTLVEGGVVDGVPVPSHGVVEFAEGASHACEHLRRMGYALVMVTNQPDVARGSIDARTVEIDNQHIAEYLGLDLALACTHDDLDNCTCRKPRPGLLHQAASILDLHLDRTSVMIGDRWRDIAAGSAAGVTTVLLDRGYGENLTIPPDHTASNLLSATEWIADHLGPDHLGPDHLGPDHLGRDRNDYSEPANQDLRGRR